MTEAAAESQSPGHIWAADCTTQLSAWPSDSLGDALAGRLEEGELKALGKLSTCLGAWRVSFPLRVPWLSMNAGGTGAVKPFGFGVFPFVLKLGDSRVPKKGISTVPFPPFLGTRQGWGVN